MIMSESIKLAEDIYRMICVVDEYCKYKNAEFDIYTLHPIIKIIRKNADTLTCLLDPDCKEDSL